MHGIKLESGVNDCHWNLDGKCTSWDCTHVKPVGEYSRNWNTRMNCTFTQLGVVICGCYLQEGRV